MNKMKADDMQHALGDYSGYYQTLEFPKMVVLSLSYVCNARCPGCPYTNSSIRESYKGQCFISDDLFHKIADECGVYHSYIRLTGGGEPMMHPHAVELMEYAKARGAKIGLITNGSLFDEEKARKILAAQVDMIEFSVDACDEENYSRVRNGLDFNRLVKNVEMVVRLRNEMGSSTRIIASAINQKGIDLDAVEAFWKKRVDYVQLRKFLTWGFGDASKSGDPIAYLPKEKKIPCPWLFERLNIDSKGKATLCGYDISFDYDFGDVTQSSVKSVWHSEKFENIRKLHLSGNRDQVEICKTCTDGQYRTWTYNYFELVKNAEKNRNTSEKIDAEE